MPPPTRLMPSHLWLSHLFLILVTYCCTRSYTQDDLPTRWLGSSIICDVTPAHCSLFGMRFIRSSKTGDGGLPCLSGEKVLCQMLPQPGLQPVPTPASTLSVLTYNLFNWQYLIFHNGQRERTCRLPAAISTAFPQVDVLVFTEAWAPGCFDDPDLDLRRLLRLNGFSYHTENVDGTDLLKNNGGVFIASRWPITDVEQRVFTSLNELTTERFSHKGVMYARIVKEVGGVGRVYHVFGTHLQSGLKEKNEGVRLEQVKEIADFMNELNLSENEAVIIAGDLNADAIHEREHVAHVLATLQATVPIVNLARPHNLTATYDPDDNELIEIEDVKGFHPDEVRREWVDYVLYSTQHLLPSSANMSAHRLISDTPFPVCMSATLSVDYVYPDSPFCDRAKFVREYSDHNPLLATFTF